MFYLIGLQNPGNELKKTRHNIGGEFVEWLYQQCNIVEEWHIKKNLKIAIIEIGKNIEFTLLIPQTYINNSGEIFWYFKDKQKYRYMQKTFCVADDLETPFQKVRLKSHKDKSAKGHNGLKSIKNYFGEIPHILALGIGRPSEEKNSEEISNFVLGKFSSQEQSKMDYIFEEAANVLIKYIDSIK
jgi:PTH1 family peptidyl-tRNA hydrolase